jgi:hypothetical protein
VSLALCLACLSCVAVLSWSALARAESGDQRAQLVEMLRHHDFRVRTQAAFSLGRVGHGEAVPPLVKALGDAHPAVRAAAAVALGRIGDPGALPGLRSHHDATYAVESQVQKAISLIEQGEARGQDEAAPAKETSWSAAHHYVELAGVVNVSKTKRPGLTELFETLALREMRRLPAAVVADREKRPPLLEKQLRRYQVKGYSVDASIARLVRYMSPQKVQIRAEVMLAVTSLPGLTYCMTVTGIGAVSDSRRAFSAADVPEMQQEALSGALEEAVGRLGDAIRDGAATRCHGEEAAPSRHVRRAR